MEKLIQLFVFCGLAISALKAEFTAENVYDYLSRRLDRLSFKIGIIQNEMKTQNSNINNVKNDSASIDEFRIKNMFDDFKREINRKFAFIEQEVGLQVDMKFTDLDEKVAQKVDMKFADLEGQFKQKVGIFLKEELSLILNNTKRQNQQGIDNEREHLKEHLFGIQKSLSAEKHVIRKAMALFRDRLGNVEHKMFAFEHASWKGEKGDVGHPGTTGPSGIKGSKGEKGLKGETGYKGPDEGTGNKGAREEKGLKGSPEIRVDQKTKIRLVGGDSQMTGRLEIFISGRWSTASQIGFGTIFKENDARVVCRMLGAGESGIAFVFPDGPALFGEGRGYVLDHRFKCNGNEMDLTQCLPKSSWSFSLHDDHNYDVALSCEKTELRLVDGDTPQSGRVEAFIKGNWSTICSTGFDDNDARAICNILGYKDSGTAKSFSGSHYGYGSGRIIISDLNCIGTESDIKYCSPKWNNNKCNHNNDAGVICDRTLIRLANGQNNSSGRVEIYHGGHWGTICGHNFDQNDVIVICKMLGMNNPSKSFFKPNSFYGKGIGEVVVSELQCTGAEGDIGQCKASWWPKTSSQDHDNDVGVSCDGIISVKLFDGDSNASGRVGIYHNGHYGTVCSRKFDRLDLAVVCRMLGFKNIPQSAYWHTATSHGQGIGEIVVSDLACNGIEHSIGQCGGNWPADERCDHSEDVFVNCDGAQEKIRLVNGHSHFSGRVEIFMFGQWATICDDSFDRADAAVICRMLNFPHPEKAIAHKEAHYGAADDTVPIILTDLKCNGLEQNLGQCNPTWGKGYCRHSEDIGVDCCPDCQDPIAG